MKSSRAMRRVRAALPVDELRAVLDPATYTGRAAEMVDAVLRSQRASGWFN